MHRTMYVDSISPEHKIDDQQYEGGREVKTVLSYIIYRLKALCP